MATMRPTSSANRRWLYVLVGTVITISLLAWALRGTSPMSVVQAIQQAKAEWLGLGLGTFLASFSVRAVRWGTLLGAHRHPGGFGIRQSAIFIGFAGNCLLPANAGEVIRSFVLHRFGRVPLGAALGSIFAERLLDAVIAFLFLLTPLLPVTQSHHAGLGSLPLGWIGGVLVVVCAAFLVAARWPDEIAQFAGRVSRLIGLGRWTHQIVATLRAVLSGLDALQYPRRGITAVIQTVCIWSLTGITYWSVMIAFGITSPGVIGALFVQSVASLAIALPSSPGYFGPFEAAIRFALQVYAIPPDTIVAYAIALRILMYVSLTTIGLAIAMRLGLSWKDFIPQPPTSSALPSEDGANPK